MQACGVQRYRTVRVLLGAAHSLPYPVLPQSWLLATYSFALGWGKNPEKNVPLQALYIIPVRVRVRVG